LKIKEGKRETMEKLEAILNRIILLIQSALVFLYKKLTPKKFQDFSSSSAKKIVQYENDLLQKLKVFIHKIILFIINSFQQIIIISKKIPVPLFKLFDKATHIGKKDIAPNALAGKLKKIFSPILLKFETWYNKLSPKATMFLLLGGIIATLASFQIYLEVQKVYAKVNKEKTSAPSAVEQEQANYPPRAKYYKETEKQFEVNGVRMPVYIETVTASKSLIFDLTLVASNRYTKEYFLKKEHLIKDRLNSTIEPVIPTFPLTAEGKQILRTKIRLELNKLIKDLKIQGKVDKVLIHGITSG
jgi:hypothetical protein